MFRQDRAETSGSPSVCHKSEYRRNTVEMPTLCRRRNRVTRFVKTIPHPISLIPMKIRSQTFGCSLEIGMQFVAPNGRQQRRQNAGSKLPVFRPRSEEALCATDYFSDHSVVQFLQCAGHANSACRNHRQRKPNIRQYFRTLPGCERCNERKGFERKGCLADSCKGSRTGYIPHIYQRRTCHQ